MTWPEYFDAADREGRRHLCRPQYSCRRNAIPFSLLSVSDVCAGRTNEAAMKLKVFAITAVLAAGVSGAAMAQYACPAGYTYYGGACQPAATAAPGGYSNPVSGAVNGTAAGAANGAATAGPVGAIVGGAVGTATGAVTGATNTATGVVNGATAPLTGGRCAMGYYLASNGYCYPNR
jgi:osmotically inducible lipoprotein OsmB